jgi:thiamine biosynthesis lipoprotein
LTWRGVALGAHASLTLQHANDSAGREAIAECLTEVARLESIFSLHRPDSAIATLNRTGELADAPGDFRILLAQALSLAERTGGAFDPTVQPLWSLYARHFAKAGTAPEGPSDREVDEARILVGWRHVEINGAAVRLAKSGMAITLNGIAQGYITDKVGAVLRRRGFDHVLVNMGEQLALGPKADGTAWQIGITEPHARSASGAEEAISARIPLSGGALATSETLGTTFDPAFSVSHILDGRTGRPAQAWSSVSVLAPTATLADALSTALAILPAVEAPRLLGSDCRAFLISGHGQGGVWL